MDLAILRLDFDCILSTRIRNSTNRKIHLSSEKYPSTRRPNTTLSLLRCPPQQQQQYTARHPSVALIDHIAAAERPRLHVLRDSGEVVLRMGHRGCSLKHLLLRHTDDTGNKAEDVCRAIQDVIKADDVFLVDEERHFVKYTLITDLLLIFLKVVVAGDRTTTTTSSQPSRSGHD